MNAQTAAREIAAKIPMAGHVHSETWWLPVLTPIIQQAIDEAVKEERERYVKLAEKWKNKHKAGSTDLIGHGMRQAECICAAELLSLTGGSP